MKNDLFLTNLGICSPFYFFLLQTILHRLRLHHYHHHPHRHPHHHHNLLLLHHSWVVDIFCSYCILRSTNVIHVNIIISIGCWGSCLCGVCVCGCVVWWMCVRYPHKHTYTHTSTHHTSTYIHINYPHSLFHHNTTHLQQGHFHNQPQWSWQLRIQH